MRVSIWSGGSQYILGVVELVDVEVGKNGKIEFYYHDVKSHSVGMKYVRFRIQRWFKSDAPGNTNLLYSLHQNNSLFDLSEFTTDDLSVFSGLNIQQCIIYTYRLLGGSTNDIIAEEAVGEGLLWSRESGGDFEADDFESGDFVTEL